MRTLKIEKITSPDLLLTPVGRERVGVVNWVEYPYCPDVTFNIGYTPTHLYIQFFVSEKNIKAAYLNDNEAVWEDSCVEFFVKLPGEQHYFNFETNCIGTGLAARRLSKTDAQHLSEEQMQRIVRISSLPHEKIDSTDDEWTLLLGVPFDILGCSTPPAKILTNIYKCGDNTAEPHFVSWSPIGSDTPNFHLPEFFGEMTLE